MSHSSGFHAVCTFAAGVVIIMLANQRFVENALESSWNVDSDRVIGRNFPLKIHEVRAAYFRLLALTKDTRFCKAMM